jgi:hypothetical protein
VYSVSRLTHETYGPVIVIEQTLNGSELTPFQAVQSACKDRRLWLETGLKKVRILVDNQILSPKQAEQWAREEYDNLPKCPYCVKVLNGKVFSHQLSGGLFCSQECADRDYTAIIEKQKDEEEIDYL